MEMKYILYSKVHKTTDADETWTFKFRPVGPEYKKVCIFTVSSADPYDTLGALGLPETIGDVISLNVKEKNAQGKLKLGKKEAAN